MAKTQYGWQHQTLRAQWDQHLSITGPHPCRRCGRPVHPDQTAHLNFDHAKFDLGHPHPCEPEHQSCNRKAGGRSSHSPASEDWW